jgi:hypothetical protein
LIIKRFYFTVLHLYCKYTRIRLSVSIWQIIGSSAKPCVLREGA